MLHSQIPGYTRARHRAERLEASWRNRAFLEELPETLCGVSVRMLTARMFNELAMAKSPFLCGGPIYGQDVAIFLWRLSPGFSRTDEQARKAFAESVRAIAYEREPFFRAVRAITRFIDRMLLDKPPQASGPDSTPDTTFVAAMCHTIGKSYGWPISEILDKPMPMLLQFLRLIQRDADPKLPHLNPLQARLTKRILDRHRARQTPPAADTAA